MKKFQEVDITPILQQSKEDVLEAVKTLVRPYQLPPREISLGQRQALNKLCAGWYITACWLANPNGESNKRLFNAPEFQDRRSWAAYLNKLLKLCIEVKKNLPGTPCKTGQQWGIECLCEWQKWGVSYILNFDPGTPVYKSHKIEKLGLLYKEMTEAYLYSSKRKVAQNPFTKKEGQLHHYELFRCASNLAVKLPEQERTNFCRDFWAPFLSSIRGYKNSIKRNSALKVALPHQDALLYQGVGKDRRKVNLINSKILIVNPDFYQ